MEVKKEEASSEIVVSLLEDPIVTRFKVNEMVTENDW